MGKQWENRGGPLLSKKLLLKVEINTTIKKKPMIIQQFINFSLTQ